MKQYDCYYFFPEGAGCVPRPKPLCTCGFKMKPGGFRTEIIGSVMSPSPKLGSKVLLGGICSDSHSVAPTLRPCSAGPASRAVGDWDATSAGGGKECGLAGRGRQLGATIGFNTLAL